MKNETDDKIFQLAYECAIKGIDIEKTIESIKEFLNSDFVKQIFDLASKNYNYLKGVQNDKTKTN